MIKKIIRKVRDLLPVSLIFLVMVALSYPVYAAYDYYIPIRIFDNTATPVANIPILISINNSSLNTGGYIQANALDTDVQETGSGPYSVATSRLGVFVSSLAAYQTKTYNYLLTFTPAQTDYDLITGYDGNITRADAGAAGMELGDNFAVEIKGWVDTDAGSDKNLIYKKNAFKIYISGGTDITADIDGGAKTATASGIASGEHTIRVVADGTDMKIFVDTVEEGTVALAGTSAPDNGDDWAFGENNALPYVEYIKIWVSN